ncbi:uncharacterized protein DUF222 [Pseudonocardia kunmingensis]|uniref:Uncharacterized protein DUF222 n=1 Tax=Pseudonocardia kunmingensis TaxID=630975 RepID=A0A543DZL1_9PSEU|nr:uncharacterized protein DUF222 [Pseudonocardia kunmingensis]
MFGSLTRLAKGLGKDDPRGIDARRSDLVVALLTGALAYAAFNTDADTDADTGDAADADTADDTDSDAAVDYADTGAVDDADATADMGAAADDDSGPGPTGAADTGTVDPGAADTGCAAGRGVCERCGSGDSSSGSGGGGLLPRPVTPTKPLVQVLVPLSTLAGLDDQPCELVGHGPIPAQLAREIAVDANLRRLVYDPLSGTVLDYGRTTYRPPAGLADFVRARDVYCRSPICRRRVLDSHLEHVVPFPQGPTNEKNLDGLCGHDHVMKHAPGWAVRALPDGRIQWITPTGHRYCSHPYDYRPDPDPPTAPRRDRPEPRSRGPRMSQQDYDGYFARRPTDPPTSFDETGPPPF